LGEKKIGRPQKSPLSFSPSPAWWLPAGNGNMARFLPLKHNPFVFFRVQEREGLINDIAEPLFVGPERGCLGAQIQEACRVTEPVTAEKRWVAKVPQRRSTSAGAEGNLRRGAKNRGRTFRCFKHRPPVRPWRAKPSLAAEPGVSWEIAHRPLPPTPKPFYADPAPAVGAGWKNADGVGHS